MTIGRPRWVRILWVRLRRGLGRLDRAAPAWLFWLPSWGTSLVIHGLALFVPSAFAGRTLDRGERVRREGGTTESERAVELGLGWLARHQRGDGGWSLDVHSECKGNPACPEGPPTNSDTAATGLALLTYLAAGHTYHRPGPYQDQVQRAIGWLLRNQQKTGELFT
jgi:hypothetical protein